MSGAGKRRAASSSSSSCSTARPSKSKAARTESAGDGGGHASKSSWCSRCWARPGDECSTQDHEVLPLGQAQDEARAAVAESQRAVAEAQRAVAKAQRTVAEAQRAARECRTRLDTVLDADAGVPIVMEARFIGAESMEENIMLNGETMLFKLAYIDGGLSDTEKEAVIKALEGSPLEVQQYRAKGPVAVKGHIKDSLMASVLQRLTPCMESQKLACGSILYCPKARSKRDDGHNFFIHDSDASVSKVDVRCGARLFGQLTNHKKIGLRAGYMFDPENDGMYESEKYVKMYRLSTTHTKPASSKLINVKFVDSPPCSDGISPPGTIDTTDSESD